MRRSDPRNERLLGGQGSIGGTSSADLGQPLGNAPRQQSSGPTPTMTMAVAEDDADTLSSSSSTGLAGDVVPPSSLSNRYDVDRLAPLERPADLPYTPPASASGVLPDLRVDKAQKAGSIGMIFSLWNTMMGSTLLVMPYTFWEAGWLLALLLSVAGALIAQFSCSLILHYAQGMMADPSAEFADLARVHFGEPGRVIAFCSGNFVILGAAIAMHGYMATVLAHLIAFTPAHGGFCTAAAAKYVGDAAFRVAAGGHATLFVDGGASRGHHHDEYQQVIADDGAILPPPPPLAPFPTPHVPRPPSHTSPCLRPLVDLWPPIHPHVPPPVLVCVVLLVTVPLSNLPSIKLLARLNSVGVLCFMIILGFAIASAAVAGVDVDHAFTMAQMFKPASAGIVFGIFSLSFFIHNAVITIMRGAAKPRNNSRDLSLAYLLTWACYAAVGASSNICPPLHNISALGSPEAKNGILSIEQPKQMATLLVIARLAVLVQSMSVYPVLLFIVRSQVASAFIWKRPYPGPLPTLGMSSLMAAITTSFTCLGVDIATVLKFAGAGGGLVCIYGLPALMHYFASQRQGTLTLSKRLIVAFLLSYGLLCLCMQLIPIPPPKPSDSLTDDSS